MPHLWSILSLPSLDYVLTIPGGPDRFFVHPLVVQGQTDDCFSVDQIYEIGTGRYQDGEGYVR